jgi:hypothetical protein
VVARPRTQRVTIDLMTTDGDNTPDPTPDEPAPSFRSALRGLRRAATEAASAGAEEARKLAETARPEIERRAQQAKAAAEAARPRVEQKARDAADYVREHQDEIVDASKRGASVAASGAARAVTPGPLRPAIDAMERELRTPAESPEATEPSEESDTEAPSDGSNIQDRP